MFAQTQTMTAWRQSRYGGADALAPVSVPIPEPGRGEVLVQVEVCALNAGDVRLMRGDPWLVRLAFGLRRPRQGVRGMDAAGRIVTVGEGVEASRVGEAIVVELPGGGGLAPYALAPIARIVQRPVGVDAAAAACLPIAAGTAVQALDLAGVTAGDRVLVLGASGGVGTFAVQLAAGRGAEVDALCGEPNRALVEELGAARTWDYRTTALDALPGGYDAVIDIAGTAPLWLLRRLLAPRGVLVMVAGTGGRVLGPIPRMLGAALLSIGSRRRLRALAAVAKPEVLADLLDRLERGEIRAVIEAEHPLAEAGGALARQDSGHVVGKLVVRVGE